MIWHTRNERKIIKKYGGKPLKKYGTDGVIKGKPVEVREVRKDHRYRIQKNIHNKLINKGGSYIFVKGNKSKKVSAKKVSEMIGHGKWFKDRNYPHKFLNSKKII